MSRPWSKARGMSMVHDATVLQPAAVRSIVLGILLAMFLGALDQTIVSPALPTVGRSLGDLETLPWVMTAYLLTATAVTPLYGKLSDIYGRRRMLLVAITVFLAGSVAAAVAPTMMALIIGRALQGLGGGGLLPLAQVIVADVVPPRERGLYQGYIAIVYALASLSGPVIGGLLAEYLHWSLIFWINLPLGIIALLITNRALARLPRHERPHRLDLAGAALMMAAGFVLLLALTWGGTRYAWNSQQIRALLAGSLVLWLLFAARLFRAPEPFLPLTLLFDRVVALGTASVSFVFGTMIGLSIFVPMYFEQVRHLSVSQSGLALIPLMGGAVLGSTLSGRCISRLVHYKRVPLLGLAAAIAGTALIATDPSGQRLLVVVVALAGVGTGIGTLYPVTTVSVQNAVPLHQLGTATGAMNFFRQLAGAIVVAGFAAIVLHGAGDPYGTTVGALAVAGVPRPDLVEAFRWVFVAAATALGAGLLCLAAMEERPLRGRVPSSAAATVAGE